MTTANLEADNPLLLAGLERAAELANIQVVAQREAAVLSLRSAGSGLSHPRVDIAIDIDRIIISVRQQPPPSTWGAIYRLIGHLAGTVSCDVDSNETPVAQE